jgi:predicted RecA/RadA family phage recombinase
MGSTYKQPGSIISYTAPATAVTVNQVVSLNNGIGVALSAIPASTVGLVSVKGVHNLPALSTDAWSDGDLLWWDFTAGSLTRLGSPLHRYAGRAVGAKLVTTGLRADVDLNNSDGVADCLLDRQWIDDAVGVTFAAATHSGSVIAVTVASKTVTLPVGVVGMEAVILNNAVDGSLLTVDLNGNEIIAGGNLTIAATKTAVNTALTARRGDFLHLVCNVAATSWRCVRRRGVWVTS